MNLRPGKLPIAAGIVLITASLSLGSSVPAKKTPAKKPSVKHSTSSSKMHKTSRYASKKSRKPRGQQAIDGERTREIQEALVREHYLNGEPSGKWDDATQGALRRYQADQGWQSKSVPDSRALIRLGLGPDHEHLLNPETAMTMSMAPQFKRTSQTVSAPAAYRPQTSQNRASMVRAASSPSASSSQTPLAVPDKNAAAPVSSAPDLSPSR
jgi:peptidoglycan hydrolase-like protein with peptidoglycan-binding domain